jgi:protease-4
MSTSPAYKLQDKTILVLDLNSIIHERENSSPFDFLFGGTGIKSYGLDDILSAIRKAKDNDKIKGIYIKAGLTDAGYATAAAIRNALIDFKESGKFIVSYGETISQRSYYIASVSDKVFMNPQGMLELMGLGTSRQYNKGVYEKWGIKIQVFKVGTYKSYVEPYTQDKMSDANREQVTAYLNDIWTNLLTGISESRNIPVDDLNRYADEYLLFSKPESIVEYRLVDELKYGTEVESYLKELVSLDADKDLKLADVKNMTTVPDSQKKFSKDQIAVLYAEGSIVGDLEANMYSGDVITAKTYVEELKKLQKDDNVKAVVFRVNSPGGSSYASYQIWHAVKELEAVKPVIVSMGDVAASGGYYISCGATKIVAEPTTLTGSIGIFGMFPSGEELSKRLGANYDGYGTNKHTLLGSEILSLPLFIADIGLLPARPLNEGEVKLFQTFVERGYNTFTGCCAEGRSKTQEEIDKIGQGRVWTGNQALAIGLVDELGDINKAIQLAAEAAGISEYSLTDYPVKKDFFTELMEESLSGMNARIGESILGKDMYQQKQQLKAWQDYDYLQAVMMENY